MTDELFQEHKDELPDEWHSTFDELTAQGKSPSGIKATIEYVTTKKTQQEVSREFGVSDPTIRSLEPAVIALGPVDSRTASAHHSDHETTVDHASYIADILGWEEGVEYSISDKSHGSAQQARLLAAGWRDLRDQLSGHD